MIDISKYTSFFHDGSINDIINKDNNIILIMESAQIDEEDLKEPIPLTKDQRINGKLHIENIKSISVNKILTKKIEKILDDGEIMDFEIDNNHIFISFLWDNYPRKPKINEYHGYDIEAEKIWWENTPDE